MQLTKTRSTHSTTRVTGCQVAQRQPATELGQQHTQNLTSDALVAEIFRYRPKGNSNRELHAEGIQRASDPSGELEPGNQEAHLQREPNASGREEHQGELFF